MSERYRTAWDQENEQRERKEELAADLRGIIRHLREVNAALLKALVDAEVFVRIASERGSEDAWELLLQVKAAVALARGKS